MFRELPYIYAKEIWTSVYQTYPILRRVLAILADSKFSIPDQEHCLLKEFKNPNVHEWLKEQDIFCQPVSQSVGCFTEHKELRR